MSTNSSPSLGPPLNIDHTLLGIDLFDLSGGSPTEPARPRLERLRAFHRDDYITSPAAISTVRDFKLNPLSHP
jgi:hypothetical protein